MNSTTIEVKEAVLVETYTVKKVVILVAPVQLRHSCQIAYHLLDATGRIVKGGTMELTGEDYLQWGADDGYVEQFVLSRLGLSHGAAAPTPR